MTGLFALYVYGKICIFLDRIIRAGVAARPGSCCHPHHIFLFRGGNGPQHQRMGCFELSGVQF